MYHSAGPSVGYPSAVHHPRAYSPPIPSHGRGYSPDPAFGRAPPTDGATYGRSYSPAFGYGEHGDYHHSSYPPAPSHAPDRRGEPYYDDTSRGGGRYAAPIAPSTHHAGVRFYLGMMQCNRGERKGKKKALFSTGGPLAQERQKRRFNELKPFESDGCSEALLPNVTVHTDFGGGGPSGVTRDYVGRFAGIPQTMRRSDLRPNVCALCLRKKACFASYHVWLSDSQPARA